MALKVNMSVIVTMAMVNPLGTKSQPWARLRNGFQPAVTANADVLCFRPAVVEESIRIAKINFLHSLLCNRRCFWYFYIQRRFGASVFRRRALGRRSMRVMFSHNQRRVDWPGIDPEKRGTNQGLGTKRGTTVRFLQQLTGA